MGTFEKLGILVIVVIIVMILAVAIYQWGGAGGAETTTVVGTSTPPTITVKTLDELAREDAEAAKTAPVQDPGVWPGGIPKRYRVQRDDKMWVLVVKRWGLKESFLKAVEQANAKIDFKRLKPGTEIVIPDPSAYTRTNSEKQSQPQKPSGARLYEVKGGDTLESIAFLHLGAKTRWHDIVSMNPGLEPKRLFEGQEIYLPGK
jgi:nucleoid-associated protein YgaU